jgi:hypothetical protein
MARTYGAYPNIIYEIYNEPLNSTSWTDVVQYSNQVISAIRPIDPHNLIVIGTPDWSSRPNMGSNSDIPGTNLTWAMHFYAASHHETPHRNNVTNALSSGQGGLNRSVLATEFGTVNANGDGSPDVSSTQTWIRFLETNKVGWVNWAIANKAEGASIFQSSVSASGVTTWRDNNLPNLTQSGNIIRAYLRQYNVDTSGYFPRDARYTITTNVSSGNGRVEKRLGDAVSNGPFNFNDNVTIVAVPDDGWEFDGWTGDATGASESLNYRVVGINIDVSANFWLSNLVSNGTFTHNRDGWSLGGTTGGSLATQNQELVVTPPPSGEARVVQSGIRLEKGTQYTLSFKARSAQPGMVLTPRVTNSQRTRDYMNVAPISLTATMQLFQIEFVSDTTLATANLSFNFPGGGGVWYLDDVRIDEGERVSVAHGALSRRETWSTARTAGGIQLRGPAGANATAVLYDVRGRAIRTIRATDGLILGRGIPSGSYLLVVRNSAGAEVYRSRVMLAQ